jgi:hypothetical protein
MGFTTCRRTAIAENLAATNSAAQSRQTQEYRHMIRLIVVVCLLLGAFIAIDPSARQSFADSFAASYAKARAGR